MAGGKLWTKEEENLLFSLYKEKSLDELVEIIGKTKEQIKTKGWRNNITFMNYWTEEQDDFIKKNYDKMTYAEIGDCINRSKSAVQSRCRKFGLRKNPPTFKKQLNSNFFEIIDTEEKAYWLGFISADGCLTFDDESQSGVIKIALQKSDADFLKKFIQAIDGKFDLKYRKVKGYYNGEEKIYDSCEVSFRDKKMAQDLLQYITPNKTEYLKIPTNIPKELLRHYIRGFADGDGCYYCNLEKRNKSFEIVGKCYEMMDDIRKVLLENGIQSEIYRKRKTNWKLGIYRIKELVKLESYLYKDATIFMERKYNKAQEILKLAS